MRTHGEGYTHSQVAAVNYFILLCAGQEEQTDEWEGRVYYTSLTYYKLRFVFTFPHLLGGRRKLGPFFI